MFSSFLTIFEYTPAEMCQVTHSHIFGLTRTLIRYSLTPFKIEGSTDSQTNGEPRLIR